MRKREYRYPRNRPVSSKASQVKYSMSMYEIYWLQGQSIPDDFITNLDMKTVYEIRTRAIKLMNLARTIDQQAFYEGEVERLLEVLKIRIKIENQRMLEGE